MKETRRSTIVNPRYMDIVFALIFLGVFAGAYGYTLTLPSPVLPGDPGAGFFPRLISAASVIFCVMLIVKRVLQVRMSNKDQQPDSIEVRPGPFFIIAGSVAGLILAMHYIGSEISFFAFLFILLGLRTRRWLWSFIVSLLSSAVIYVVFVALLNVHLPVLFLPQYINFNF